MKISKKDIILISICLSLLILICISLFLLLILSSERWYNADDFGITTIYSDYDANNNGVDDYSDFMLGARAYTKTIPKYKSEYYTTNDGYPRGEYGVCTDVIWNAFKYAGYSLKDMIDADIAKNTNLYPRVEGSPDPYIDFRRVKNLIVFFDRYAIKLTCDKSDVSQWQPGDIVIYKFEYSDHIAIISDIRNKAGQSYIIHHSGSYNYEEENYESKYIIGHYRFDYGYYQEMLDFYDSIG